MQLQVLLALGLVVAVGAGELGLDAALVAPVLGQRRLVLVHLAAGGALEAAAAAGTTPQLNHWLRTWLRTWLPQPPRHLLHHPAEARQHPV